jgi:protein-disulfide isomerase
LHGWGLRSSEIEDAECLGSPARHCHNCAVQLASNGTNRHFQPEEPQLQITRREFCHGTAALALATAFIGISSLPPFPVEASAQTIPAGELMKPDALPDMAIGNDKALVTIIEYASMTCPHCAHFQETTFPELKKRYIDTGKVRYIFREFPLDNLAAAAFMLARCASKDDNDKYFALIDTLFRQQRQWAIEKPIPPLLAIAKQAGLTEQTFNACLANQQVLDGIESVRKRAVDKFKVQSTPTFFINGTPHPGALTIDEMAKLIDPYLKG